MSDLKTLCCSFSEPCSHLRSLVRVYYNLTDERFTRANNLQGILRVAFSQHLNAFFPKSPQKHFSKTILSIPQANYKSKTKIVALGAVIHKIIVFTVLRDAKPFEIIPQENHNFALTTAFIIFTCIGFEEIFCFFSFGVDKLFIKGRNIF